MFKGSGVLGGFEGMSCGGEDLLINLKLSLEAPILPRTYNTSLRKPQRHPSMITP
jgi:hypothetical protein